VIQNIFLLFPAASSFIQCLVDAHAHD